MVEKSFALTIKKLTEGSEQREKVQLVSDVFEAMDADPRDCGNYFLEAGFDQYLGNKIGRSIPDLLWLHDEMSGRGFTENHRYDFGYGDRYAFCVPTRDPKKIKVLAFQTQNLNYLVVLSEKYGEWELHMRRWWDNFAEEEKKGRYMGFGPKQFSEIKRKKFQDVARFAEAAQQYSDNLPGVSYVHRPDLVSFKAGGFVVGSTNAGPGLRFGDMRDSGYLVSVKKCPAFGEYEADKAIRFYGDIKRCLYDLNSAVDTFREEGEASGS